MKFRTFADERTRCFYVRLKRLDWFGWYWNNLGQTINRKKRLSKVQLRRELRIDRIAFFKKHFWMHFHERDVQGWIMAKRFRKNYCRLELPKFRGAHHKGPFDSRLACVIILCQYVRSRVDTGRIVRQYQLQRPRTARDLFDVVAGQLGRFKDLSHKSTRRIRGHIWHQRPVVMKLRLGFKDADVVIAGFNRRVFFYVAPPDVHLRFITRKRLLKAWRQCGYQAFSC